MNETVAKPIRMMDRKAFIKLQTRLTPVPHAPSILLHLADDAVELWQKTETDLEKIGLPPPFWAFAWAGGQALARHLLMNEVLVRGKRVLDFASGSGLVGIAAAKAGAVRVEACDIDLFAIDAIGVNASSNNVKIIARHEDLIGQEGNWQVILAGDICYERETAERVITWLERMAKTGKTVLIGDPGRSYLPKDRLDIVATYEVPVTRTIEDSDIKKTSIWRFRS